LSAGDVEKKATNPQIALQVHQGSRALQMRNKAQAKQMTTTKATKTNRIMEITTMPIITRETMATITATNSQEATTNTTIINHEEGIIFRETSR
jgi:hypothetical protein